MSSTACIFACVFWKSRMWKQRGFQDSHTSHSLYWTTFHPRVSQFWRKLSVIWVGSLDVQSFETTPFKRFRCFGGFGWLQTSWLLMTPRPFCHGTPFQTLTRSENDLSIKMDLLPTQPWERFRKKKKNIPKRFHDVSFFKNTKTRQRKLDVFSTSLIYLNSNPLNVRVFQSHGWTCHHCLVASLAAQSKEF